MPTVLCKLSRDTSRISTPLLMIVAVNVGIYNVPATVSNERIDTMMTGNHKDFI